MLSLLNFPLQRILYELSLQEALAHYAGTDPSESSTWYRDAVDQGLVSIHRYYSLKYGHGSY